MARAMHTGNFLKASPKPKTDSDLKVAPGRVRDSFNNLNILNIKFLITVSFL